jgi:hypothetical protein
MPRTFHALRRFVNSRQSFGRNLADDTSSGQKKAHRRGKNDSLLATAMGKTEWVNPHLRRFSEENHAV